MIRSAREDDLPWLIEASYRSHIQCGYKDIAPFDHEQSMEVLKTSLCADHAKIYVGLSGDQLCGCILVGISTMLFSKRSMATEYLWYTDDDLCGPSMGVRLYLQAEKWAVENGAEGMLMASVSGHKQLETIQFYSKMGYDPNPREMIFFKEL